MAQDGAGLSVARLALPPNGGDANGSACGGIDAQASHSATVPRLTWPKYRCTHSFCKSLRAPISSCTEMTFAAPFAAAWRNTMSQMLFVTGSSCILPPAIAGLPPRTLPQRRHGNLHRATWDPRIGRPAGEDGKRAGTARDPTAPRKKRAATRRPRPGFPQNLIGRSRAEPLGPTGCGCCVPASLLHGVVAPTRDGREISCRMSRERSGESAGLSHERPSVEHYDGVLRHCLRRLTSEDALDAAADGRGTDRAPRQRAAHTVSAGADQRRGVGCSFPNDNALDHNRRWAPAEIRSCRVSMPETGSDLVQAHVLVAGQSGELRTTLSFPSERTGGATRPTAACRGDPFAASVSR